MKTIYIAFLSLIACLGVTHSATAQTAKESFGGYDSRQFSLPPVMSLVDSAIKHNAMVRLRNLEIEAKNSNLTSQKNSWSRNLGVQADSRYGTFDNFSSNANGLSTSIFNTTSRQLNYGIGVYMKFPILDMLDRKNIIKKAKLEVEQAKSMAEAQTDEIKQLVIRQYQDVLLKQRILSIKSDGLSNAKLNMDMVQKEFSNGTIPVSEYVRISEIVDRAKTEYETAKTEFITVKMILEDFIGFTLNTENQAK